MTRLMNWFVYPVIQINQSIFPLVLMINFLWGLWIYMLWEPKFVRIWNALVFLPLWVTRQADSPLVNENKLAITGVLGDEINGLWRNCAAKASSLLSPRGQEGLVDTTHRHLKGAAPMSHDADQTLLFPPPKWSSNNFTAPPFNLN